MTTSPRLSDLTEEGFLAKLAARLPHQAQGLTVGIGDDGAVLEGTGRDGTVVTMDLLIEGTHFTRETLGTPRRLGRKSISVNASDIAAMGAQPTFVTVGLSAPGDWPVAFLDALYDGMAEACERYGCHIIGGDTTRGPSLHLSITMLGRLAGGGTGFLRSTARVGQFVYVTGWPGESAAGLDALLGRHPGRGPSSEARARWIRRHQDPHARVATGRALRALYADAALAMVDVSDGLVHEMGLIARASGVGIVFDPLALPVSEALRELAKPIPYCLHGGEDYELLFTCDDGPEALSQKMQNREGADQPPVACIGRVIEEPGVFEQTPDGPRPVRAQGFAHF